MAVLPREKLRHVLHRWDLFRQHAPLIETAGGFHQKIRIRFGDRLAVRLRARLELKLALVPDRQRVNGLFADQIADRGVNHLTALEENVSTLVIARQGKFPRLSGNTDQLDDVRKGQFFERSLE